MKGYRNQRVINNIKIHYYIKTLMECPNCGSEINQKELKSWNYAKYLVKRYICPECKVEFNVYYEKGIEVFTIPKRTSV